MADGRWPMANGSLFVWEPLFVGALFLSEPSFCGSPLFVGALFFGRASFCRSPLFVGASLFCCFTCMMKRMPNAQKNEKKVQGVFLYRTMCGMCPH